MRAAQGTIEALKQAKSHTEQVLNEQNQRLSMKYDKWKGKREELQRDMDNITNMNERLKSQMSEFSSKHKHVLAENKRLSSNILSLEETQNLHSLNQSLSMKYDKWKKEA